MTDAAPTADAAVDALPDGPAGAWLAGYAHRKRVTITANATIALADFPVSVLETADSDLAARARPDGRDIVFTASDALTVVGSELVAFDPQSGALDAWVRTTLPATAPTVVFMYYGGPVAVAPPAWSGAFAGVWHMGGVAATAPDSTSHGNAATQGTVAAQPAIVGGLVGTARSYDGAADALAIPSPSDGSLDFDTKPFSFSVWVFVTSSVGAYDIPLHKGGGSLTEVGYDMELGTGAWTANLSDGIATKQVQFGPDDTFLNRWVQLVAVVDRAGGHFRGYADGVLVAMTDLSSGSLTSTHPLELGSPTDLFHGILDEVRVYTVAVSASWIAAEHANLANRNQFLSIGPQE